MFLSYRVIKYNFPILRMEENVDYRYADVREVSICYREIGLHMIKQDKSVG
jgi:hypothetical protein